MSTFIITRYSRQQRFMLAVVILLCVSLGSKAQRTVTGNNNHGEFTDPVSITLTDGFTAKPIGMQSVYLHVVNADHQLLTTAPSTNQNYIISYTPRKPSLTDPDNPAHTTAEVMVGIQYMDALGRPLQSVQVKASPYGRDIVQPVVYDAFGREAVKCLPYTLSSTDVSDGSYKTTAIAKQAAFYNPAGSSGTQLPDAIARITTPYAGTSFEPSPMSRVLEQGAAGEPWQLTGTTGLSVTPGHTVKSEYDVNVSSEVAYWVISSGGGASTSAFYTAGKLYKTIIKDENWTSGKTGIIEEFKDLLGNVVLKRVWQDESIHLDTYYVYDDFDNLTYVIPPGVTATSFTEAPTDADFNNYIYAYHYDGRNRVDEKKIPGMGWQYIAYNVIGQVVATQDAVQHPDNKWTFTKYDSQGRVIMTGEITDSRTQKQITAAIVSQTINWESSNNAYADGYTTNNSFPNSWNMLYTVNYYDDYTFPGNTTFAPTATGMAIDVTGMLTGSKTRVLTTGTMLLTENFYDMEGRLRETIAQNNIGGYDRVVNDYNFNGQPVQSVRTHNSSTITNLIITNQYTYDHMGRKTRTLQQTGAGQPQVVISKLEYNELGQLKTKYLHGIINGSDTTYLQDIKYTYNERGWFKTQISGKFTEELKYQDAINGMLPQYNGNIANQLYTNATTNTFNYQYDALNRLTSGAATGMNELLTYDVMGNIHTLSRDGGTAGTYYYNGNRLDHIATGPLTTNIYVYDVNGNTTTGRDNKVFSYNFLNLPATVSGGITYTYLANGTKIRKQGSTIIDYVNGIQYLNGTIDFVQTEEGIARKTGNNYSYEYNLKDHLGNIRVTFYKNPNTNAIEALQRDDYYAFGLDKPALVNTNKYLYNGKELQDELGQYDYGARFYDPVIGRWTSVDPLAEKMRRHSVYNYGFDDPIRFTDPDGKGPKDILIQGTDGKEIRIKAAGPDITYHVPVALGESQTIHGLEKIDPGRFAFGYTITGEAGFSAAIGIRGGVDLSVVNFTDAKYTRYNYVYAGFHAGESLGIQADISANVGASIFVAYNTGKGSLDPKSWQGAFLNFGGSADIKAIVGGGGSVTYFTDGAPKGGWRGFSIGFNVGVGLAVNAGSGNFAVSNSVLLNNVVPTSQRNFIDRSTNFIAPIPSAFATSIGTDLINRLKK